MKRYWPVIPIELALLFAVKSSWNQQTISWREWSQWYLAQPIPDMNMIGVGTGVLQEPFLPLFWVAISGGLAVLFVCFPFMWHTRVKRQLVNLCPKCHIKMVRGQKVQETDHRLRINKVCPNCGMGEMNLDNRG